MYRVLLNKYSSIVLQDIRFHWEALAHDICQPAVFTFLCLFNLSKEFNKSEIIIYLLTSVNVGAI